MMGRRKSPSPLALSSVTLLAFRPSRANQIERQTGDEPALVALWFPLEKEGSAKISYIYIDIPGLTMTGNSICLPVQGRLET